MVILYKARELRAKEINSGVVSTVLEDEIVP